MSESTMEQTKSENQESENQELDENYETESDEFEQDELESDVSQPFLSRLNVALLSALVLQFIIGVVVFWPSGSATASGEPLLGELESAGIIAVTITDPNEDEIRLERTGDGWIIAGTDGFPVTASKIEDLLTKLVGIVSDRLVTQTAASHKHLQVASDDFTKRVTLSTDSGGETLYIGSSAGAGATHIRVDGQNEAYLTGDVNAFDYNTRSVSWVETLYSEVERDQVTTITLENANGTFSFEREIPTEEGSTPGAWMMVDLAEGEELNESAVTSLLGQLASIRLATPLGKTAQESYGMAEPQATARILLQGPEGESAVELHLGSQEAESNNYYFKSSLSEHYVEISSFTGDQMLEKSRTDFLVEQEEPEATDSGVDSGAGLEENTDDTTNAAQEGDSESDSSETEESTSDQEGNTLSEESQVEGEDTTDAGENSESQANE